MINNKLENFATPLLSLKEATMKIALATPLLTLDQPEANLKAIIKTCQTAHEEKADLVLFGEAALQGFEAINFDYQHDIPLAVGLSSPEIAFLSQTAKDLGLAIGVGLYLNIQGGIYSAYLVLDKHGHQAALYKRISSGWLEARAFNNADYRLGHEAIIFELEGKKFTIMLCGDYWEDDLLPLWVELDDQVDAFLWPVHCDYRLEDWFASEKEAYRARSQIMFKPILYVNNYVADQDRAKGGAYVWLQGHELAAQETGETGMLMWELA